jgi:ectoine hydroxylase-related dioxygenase (phytanoyl-CoA dioxygenase family)
MTKTTGCELSEGCTIVPDVFSGGELRRVEDCLSSTSLLRSKAGIRHLLHDPGIADFTRDSRLMNIAQSVLGDAAFPFRATLFDKSADSNWLVVWHQDTALPLRKKRETTGWVSWSIKDGIDYAHAPACALEHVLAIRIHLDDSTADNGPLRVLPGTHDLGLLSDDEIHQLSLEITPVECLVDRGGLILMRPLIVHASSKTKSELTRRVLHIEYAAKKTFDGLELAFA